MKDATRWSDLRARVASAAAMAALGVMAVWFGGTVFVFTVCIVCAAMVWEAARMFDARLALGLSVMAGVVLGFCLVLPGTFALPLLLASGLVAAGQAQRDRPVLFGVIAWIMLGAFAMLLMRTGVGMLWIVWLIVVVIASDVAGYFAGRFVGGPKFWPKVSPNKTWSGTVAGWLAAGLVGAIFIQPVEWNASLIPISIVLSFAGQMGDIAQSAIKRRKGIKDSSNLIPGHGGVFDRFDAMLGASAAALIFKLFGLLPGLTNTPQM